MMEKSTRAAHGSDARSSVVHEPWLQVSLSSSAGTPSPDATQYVGTSPIITGPKLQASQAATEK